MEALLALSGSTVFLVAPPPPVVRRRLLAIKYSTLNQVFQNHTLGTSHTQLVVSEWYARVSLPMCFIHDVRMYDAGVQIVTWQKQVLFRQFFSHGSTSFEYEHVRFETRHARNQCAPARPSFIVVR